MAISEQANDQPAEQIGLANDDAFDLGDNRVQAFRRVGERGILRGFAHEDLRHLPGRASVARPPLG